MQDEPNPFPAWMKRHKLTIREAASALGASKDAVQRWQKAKPPQYVLMACTLYSLGIPHIQ